MEHDCCEIIHYFMQDRYSERELPYDPDEAINEIKEIIKTNKTGAIRTLKYSIEVGFFSLSGMGKLTPIQEKELREYLVKY